MVEPEYQNYSEKGGSKQYSPHCRGKKPEDEKGQVTCPEFSKPRE